MKGKVWKYGDDIDTDLIIPGRYLVLTKKEELAEHAMEGIDPKFNKKVKPGDFIVGGKNFGCGSSREHAPLALQGVGIKCVIAESFARIFYRNSINVGLLLIEAPGISDFVDTEEEITIDTKNGVINRTDGETLSFNELPKFMLDILNSGGLITYLREKYNK
jgi:3-isopropylmalate/(R)-2-methylmalate dehydratase small subunit